MKTQNSSYFEDDRRLFARDNSTDRRESLREARSKRVSRTIATVSIFSFLSLFVYFTSI